MLSKSAVYDRLILSLTEMEILCYLKKADRKFNNAQTIFAVLSLSTDPALILFMPPECGESEKTLHDPIIRTRCFTTASTRMTGNCHGNNAGEYRKRYNECLQCRNCMTFMQRVRNTLLVFGVRQVSNHRPIYVKRS